MIAGIVLAAGEGRRFGANKLLHPVAGKPMICHSLAAATQSRLDNLYVVLGHEADRVQDVIDDSFRSEDRLNSILNPNYAKGLMSSLKYGMAAIEPTCRAAVIMLADMPYVTSETVDRLVSRFEAEESLVVATVDGALTHPRVIPHRYFHRFMALGDDEKGQGIFESAGFAEVAVSNRAGRDIDTRRDVE